MDTPSAMALGKTLLEIAIAVLTVLGIVWRNLDRMITKKVDAQIAAAMAKVTETTSGELAALREKIEENHREQLDRTDGRFDALTNRIDRLLKS